MPNKPHRPAHSYIGVDNKTLHDTQFLVKQCDERVAALFSKVHNMQVDINQLNTRINKLIATLLETLPPMASTTEAEAIVRDFLNNIKPKK